VKAVNEHVCTTALVISVLLGVCSAQDTLWLRRFDFGADAQAVGIDYRDGVIAVAGAVTDDSTFSSDILVMRCNAHGETLWTRRFDSGIDDAAIEACIDADGSVVVSGYGMVFPERPGASGPLLHSSAERRHEVVKQESLWSITIRYDSAGNEKWVHIEPGKLSFGLALDEQGNCYISGAEVFQTGYDLWLVKLNPQGETLWTRTYDLSVLDLGYRLALSPDGNVALAGITGLGNIDILTARFTPTGDTLWLRRHTCPDGGYGIGVAVDQQGNVVTCGWATSADSEYIAVIKHDSVGNQLWDRLCAPGGYSESYDVACDSSGSIYVAGSGGRFPGENYLVMKLTPDGEEEWVAFYDGDGYDFCQAVVCDTLGDPITGGASTGASLCLDVLLAKYSCASGLAEECERPTRGCGRGSSSLLSSPVSLVLHAPTPGNYFIELCDLAGRRAATLHPGWLEAGFHELSLPRQAGVGFLRITGPGLTATYKTVTLR
jgi:hypothetical protein